MTGLVVGFFWIENFLFHDFSRRSIPVKRLEKAAFVARVTRAAGLLDFKKQRIRVAIFKPSHHTLGVAAGLALEPELSTRAAPIVHQAGFCGLRVGGLIHPRHT